MMQFDGEFSSVYPVLVTQAATHGKMRVARGKPHRSLFNVSIEHGVRNNLLEGLSRRFAVAELMSYVCGWDDVKWLAHFNKNIAQFSDDGIKFAGAYGPRIDQQIARVLFMLREDKHCRQAIVQIFRYEDLLSGTKDIPCNTMFQLQVFTGANDDDYLDMVIYQRSCDLVWGLPYDHFSFTCLLVLLANELDMRPGVVTRHIANAHVYLESAGYADYKRVEKAMRSSHADTWLPVPTKFHEFQVVARETRIDYETEGAKIRHPMLMKELK